MTELAPVSRRSLVDQAFVALRARILHGTWAPGERLPTEHALAEALGVGRSSVREALNRLAAGGFVDAPHSAARTVLDFRDHAGLDVLADLVVSPEGVPDLAVVRSVVEMRAAIAPDVARLAARRRTDPAADELFALAGAIPSGGDPDEAMEAGLRWWQALVLASGNLAYRLAFNTLRSTYTEGRPLLLTVMTEELFAAPRYRAVSAAVRARDPQTAGEEAAGLVALGTHALFAALPEER